MVHTIPPDHNFSLLRERRRERTESGTFRVCDSPGCPGFGVYRAPRQRDSGRDFYWFCFRHVRDYNANWNYFRGMSETQIYMAVRASKVWDCKTWRGGRTPQDGEHCRRNGSGARFSDPLGVFGMATGQGRHRRRRILAVLPKRPANRALSILGLASPATPQEIRRRALALIKRLHPDRNGGQPVDPGRLREVIWAWRELRPRSPIRKT